MTMNTYECENGHRFKAKEPKLCSQFLEQALNLKCPKCDSERVKKI